MARPQLEDGHTKIANEIVEALARVNISAYESRVLWCIFRKTYGWNKKSDRISYSQFQEVTGMDRRNLGRTIKLLIARRMITFQGECQQMEYAIQKDWEQWQDLGRKDITKPLSNGTTDDSRSPIVQRDNSEAESNHCPTGHEPLSLVHGALSNGTTKPLSNGTTTKAIKHITKALDKSNKEIKQKFGEFLNVFLTADQHEKLVKRLGPDGAKDLIERLSCYMQSRRKRYQDHYATMLNWARDDATHKPGMRTSGFAITTRRKPGTIPTEEELEKMARERGFDV